MWYCRRWQMTLFLLLVAVTIIWPTTNVMASRRSPDFTTTTTTTTSSSSSSSSSSGILFWERRSSSINSFWPTRRQKHLISPPKTLKDPFTKSMIESLMVEQKPPRGGGGATNGGDGRMMWMKKSSEDDRTSSSKSHDQDWRKIPNSHHHPVVQVLTTLLQGAWKVCQLVIPPTVATTRTVIGWYRQLPKDALLAQAGLVYCFAGGYYPTLFSSLQAAQQCGWDIMVQSIDDLTNEAVSALRATSEIDSSLQGSNLLWQQCQVVMKTVDPVKINVAMGALYTSWLGISAVLQKEYARVISLSLSLSYTMQRATHWILEPPARWIVPKDYHKWIPVVLGWGCKAAAMNIAWRIQRVLTASTSAITGGLLFARAILRMAHNRGWRLGGMIGETGRESPLDEILGFSVAGLGFWTQIEAQFKNNFSFEVPFPWNLITWPFDLLERWIQWVITKEPN